MFQGIFKSAINDANKNYIFGTGSIPIQIKSAQLATFADGTTKQQGYQVAEVNKLISTMLTGWDANGNKPKSMSDNYLELILSCDNGFVVKKRLQFPHIIVWKDDSTPYNIVDIYKEFSLDNWLKADDFENPDITLVVEPTDEILTTSTATPPEATTEQSGRFYLYYRNLPVGVNRVHIDFNIKTKTEPIDFDLEVIDGLSLKDAQTILASNDQAKINVLLSGVKDVYNFTGAEGNFGEITMHEWNVLYQQIISLNPNNKFTHDLYFYIYDESELNTKLTELEDKVELQETSIRTINNKIDGIKIESSTITATNNVTLNKVVSFAVPAGDWTILTHADFGEGKVGTITFYDAAGSVIISKGITFGVPLVVTLQSAAAKALIYMYADNVKDGGSLYLTAEQNGITDDVSELSQSIKVIKQDLADADKTLSIMTSDNLFVPSVNTETNGGVTCTFSDGHYILNGTATDYKYFWLNTSSKMSVKQGEKYALLGANVNSPMYSIGYRLYKNGVTIKTNATKTNVVLTIEEDADQLELGINVIKGVTYNNDIVEIIAVSAYSAIYPLYMQTIADIKKKPRPLLTIIDDDGYKKFHTLLLPLIVEKKVPISTAIVGKNISVENFAMTWDELKECAEAGAEILSHTYSHLSADVATNMTQPEIQTDYQKMQNIMRLHGYDGSILVFAGDSSNMTKCVNACKYVYSCGIKAGTNKTNYIDTINRYGIDRWNVIPSTTNMQTLLDTLASTGTGWMIWMIHTSNGNFQSDSVTALGNAIDYARTLGIDIVNVAAGIAYYLDGRD